jgi:5-methylcytosine-specific restriction endonuclease McrA
MRFEIILIIIAGLVMFNIYTEGKFLKLALTWKKYYQMAGVAFGAFMIYWLFKKNPAQAQNMILSSNEYIKYLPVDKNTTNILGPILDFTRKQTYRPENFTGIGSNNYPFVNMNNMENNQIRNQKNKLIPTTKRSVSESRKKIIAASQQWRCSHCKEQLDFNYQIDHKVRLEYGGSNEPSNLTALCPNCHSKKTILEHHANSSI